MNFPRLISLTSFKLTPPGLSRLALSPNQIVMEFIGFLGSNSDVNAMAVFWSQVENAQRANLIDICQQILQQMTSTRVDCTPITVNLNSGLHLHLEQQFIDDSWQVVAFIIDPKTTRSLIQRRMGCIFAEMRASLINDVLNYPLRYEYPGKDLRKMVCTLLHTKIKYEYKKLMKGANKPSEYAAKLYAMLLTFTGNGTPLTPTHATIKALITKEITDHNNKLSTLLQNVAVGAETNLIQALETANELIVIKLRDGTVLKLEQKNSQGVLEVDIKIINLMTQNSQMYVTVHMSFHQLRGFLVNDVLTHTELYKQQGKMLRQIAITTLTNAANHEVALLKQLGPKLNYVVYKNRLTYQLLDLTHRDKNSQATMAILNNILDTTLAKVTTT